MNFTITTVLLYHLLNTLVHYATAVNWSTAIIEEGFIPLKICGKKDSFRNRKLSFFAIQLIKLLLSLPVPHAFDPCSPYVFYSLSGDFAASAVRKDEPVSLDLDDLFQNGDRV